MKTIIENLQALVDSVEFAETEYKANYVITTQDKKLITEALNQALHLHSVMQTLPLSFVEWYSGMQREKILRAYERWQKESGIVTVGQRSVGQSGRVGCVHNTLKYIGPWYSCETCGTHFDARAEAPPEGALDF